MELDEPAWLFERETAQKKIVHQAENCGVEPDSEGESYDCQEREPWRFKQLPQSKPKVSQHRSSKVEMRRRARLDSNQKTPPESRFVCPEVFCRRKNYASMLSFAGKRRESKM